MTDERQTRIDELIRKNNQRTDLPGGIPPTQERIAKFNSAILKIHPSYRERWCAPGNSGCACIGCANHAGGLLELGFKKSDWEAWKASTLEHKEPE